MYAYIYEHTHIYIYFFIHVYIYPFIFNYVFAFSLNYSFWKLLTIILQPYPRIMMTTSVHL